MNKKRYEMRCLVAMSLVVSSALGNLLFGQQVVAPVVNDADKPRVFITDSSSWSTQGSVGGAQDAFGGAFSGGARPQTAEIIKTFGQRCPQVLVNNRLDVSNYIVELDHEGGKSLLAHKDKIAVFIQKSGDNIFSKSTLSVGGSVQDACAAVLAHWAAHASELKAGPVAVVASKVEVPAAALVAQPASITVDASAPNSDIEVDGNFMGNTPSTLNLVAGKHQIVVKKAGYQDWTRRMMVSTGVVRVSAEMVAVK